MSSPTSKKQTKKNNLWCLPSPKSLLTFPLQPHAVAQVHRFHKLNYHTVSKRDALSLLLALHLTNRDVLRSLYPPARSHDRSEALGKWRGSTSRLNERLLLGYMEHAVPSKHVAKKQTEDMKRWTSDTDTEPTHTHSHTHSSTRHCESSPGPHFTLCRHAARRRLVTAAPPSRPAGTKATR